MPLPEYFISCDWGTTNFRLRIVRTDSLEVGATCQTDVGVKQLYDESLKLQKDQGQFFMDYLLQQLQLLPEEYQDYMIVASGMVSSSIGLLELPYSDLPLDGKGKSLNRKLLKLGDGHEIILVSGVKCRDNVMRGEEVQAVGLHEHLKSHGDGILVLPGTHSKHLTYKEGQFTDMKNFMTGELFAVLSENSILSNSIVPVNFNQGCESSFIEGVRLGVAGQLTGNLLKVRGRDLLNFSTKEDNYFFLSGLLVGNELSYLKEVSDTVFLAASEPLNGLYKLAIGAVLRAGGFVGFDEIILEQALLAGHKKILSLNDE